MHPENIVMCYSILFYALVIKTRESSELNNMAVCPYT